MLKFRLLLSTVAPRHSAATAKPYGSAALAVATERRHRFPSAKSGVALRFPPHSRAAAPLFTQSNPVKMHAVGGGGVRDRVGWRRGVDAVGYRRVAVHRQGFAADNVVLLAADA